MTEDKIEQAKELIARANSAAEKVDAANKAAADALDEVGAERLLNKLEDDKETLTEGCSSQELSDSAFAMLEDAMYRLAELQKDHASALYALSG